MKVKELAQLAMQNGYTGNSCNGWDWIKANLNKLDYIFQSEEYKKCNGMKYKCIPLLLKREELSQEEERAISTFWYLNNEIEHERKKEAYSSKMIADGWIKLTDDVVKKAFTNKQKLQVNARTSNDWMTYSIKDIYKPFVSSEGYCYLMKPRARTRGTSLCRFENAFCKIV